MSLANLRNIILLFIIPILLHLGSAGTLSDLSRLGNYYWQPCVATQPIMFYVGFLSAALRSNAADYVLPRFIFFIFFYLPFVLRNYSTDSHKILRNCVFWCSLNNSVVLKFCGRHLAEKNAKNSENLVKISRVDSDFQQ